MVDEDLIYSDLAKIIGKYRSKNLIGFSLIDIYENKAVLGDKKSVTIRFNLASMDHTLSGEEIEEFRKGFEDHIKRSGLELRA